MKFNFMVPFSNRVIYSNIFSIIAVLVLFCVSSAFAANLPVLLFSDLSDGIISGGHWGGEQEGKGTAVSVWARNCGTTRGSSYVTVGGVNLTDDSDYAEWGATTNPLTASSQQRITFWLNPNMQIGAGTIKFTTPEGTSNEIPFYCRNTGNIYFVDHNNGNNAYNGEYAVFQGGINGPRQTIPSVRPLMSGSDILYLRTGTYTETDANSCGLFLSIQQSGSENNCTAFIGYPGETPHLTQYVRNFYDENAGYMTLSKLKIRPTTIGVRIQDSTTGHFRVIGIEVDGTLQAASTWSGALGFHDISNICVYGNIIHNFGVDKYDHALYIGNNENGSQMLRFDIAWNEVFSLGDDVSGFYIHPRDTDAGYSFADDIYIHDNLVYDLEHAAILMYSRTKNINIYNNIIYNCGTEGGRSAVQLTPNPYYPTNIKFYNNLIYAGTDNSLLRLDSNTLTATLRNNIFYALNTMPYIYAGTDVSVTSDFDLYYGNGAPTAFATNAINLDPQFVNGGNYNFYLQPASPAIDTGSYYVSSIVTMDFLGNLRPMDGDENGTAEYDIGAYEYTGEYIPLINSEIPASPTGLQAR